MRRVVLFLVLLMAIGAAPAQGLTVREIIELSKSGLSDEVLLALIEVERRVFPIDPDSLKALKEAGVSERVVLAMIRSGRATPPPEAAPAPVAAAEPSLSEPAVPLVNSAPQPQVVVIDHHDQAAPVATPVYYPVYVVLPQTGTRVRGAQAPAPAPAAVSIGLPHGRLGLSAPPPRPTSDPPNWHQTTAPKPDARARQKSPE